MKWNLVGWISIGVTASVLVVRTFVGLPVVVPTVIAACVALVGSTFLSFILRPKRAPSNWR